LSYGGHNYFYSGDIVPFKKIKYDWLDGRNFCREYCMDLVSLETQEENDYFQNWLAARNPSSTVMSLYHAGAKETRVFNIFLCS